MKTIYRIKLELRLNGLRATSEMDFLEEKNAWACKWEELQHMRHQGRVLRKMHCCVAAPSAA